MAQVVDIQGALEDLKAELDAGTDVEKAFSYVCSEYGVKPEILDIRFEKLYGVKASEFVAKPNDRNLVAEALEQARKEWVSVSTLFGTRFFHKGDWWTFVAWDGSKVHAIREEFAKQWTIGGSSGLKIMASLTK